MPIEVVFNFNTGSDTQASGAPANMSPIFGNNASWTSGSTTIDLSADNPDLTNVPTDGTAVIWFESASGRNVAQIIGKNNTLKTVTVNSGNYPDITGTGRWAIGGKRKSFDDAQSRRLIEFMSKSYTVYSETDQTITSTLIAPSWANSDTYFGGPPNGHITITITVDADCIKAVGSANAINLKNVTLRCVAPTKMSGAGVRSTVESVNLRNVIIGTDATSGFWRGVWSYGTVMANNSAIQYSTDYGIYCEGGGASIFHGCLIRNNGSDGIYNLGYSAKTLLYNIIINNGGHGARIDGRYGTLYFGNIFYGNTKSGLCSDFVTERMEMYNNIFAFNGRYGVEWLQPWYVYGKEEPQNGYNCYWNNASGARLNFPAFPGDLLVDPQFKDPANLDFTVGPNLKAMGWPPSTRGIGHDQSNTRNYSYIGPAQPKQRPVPQRPVLVGVPDNAY